VLAEAAERVDAFDLSPALIEEARAQARAKEVDNVAFSVRDLEEGLPRASYDLVACMGVLVTIVDEEPYRRLLDEIAARTMPGGFLVTRDSTAAAHEGHIKVTKASIRNYRHVGSYERAFLDHGFRLVARDELLAWREFVTYSFLWKRDSAAQG
jgi:2-polyprenyl-3-methyl-5-hydroxy-6-metoxy-1,4-benzoquinol methylase